MTFLQIIDNNQTTKQQQKLLAYEAACNCVQPKKTKTCPLYSLIFYRFQQSGQSKLHSQCWEDRKTKMK